MTSKFGFNIIRTKAKTNGVFVASDFKNVNENVTLAEVLSLNKQYIASNKWR